MKICLQLVASLFILVYSTSSLSGCRTDKSRSEDILLAGLTGGLQDSQMAMAKDNVLVIEYLKEKAKSSDYKLRARFWLDVAGKIQEADKEIIEYIDSLKVRLNKATADDREKNFLAEMGRGPKLNEWINEYRKSVLNADPTINEQLKSRIDEILKFNVSRVEDKDGFIHYFNSRSSAFQMAFLEGLKNNCLLVERMILQFCKNKVPDYSESFYSYSAIVGQNTSSLLPGENLVISAGKGAFSADSTLKIRINGIEISVNEEGVAEYTIKAPSRPGKHLIPVMITYKDQDGKLETIQKDVEYTVIGKE